VLRMSEFALPLDYRKGSSCEVNKRKGTDEVSVRARSVGHHFFPPDIKAASPPRRLAGEVKAETHGVLPDHLGVTALPAKLARNLRVRQRFGIDVSKLMDKDLSEPTNVFGADDRFIF